MKLILLVVALAAVAGDAEAAKSNEVRVPKGVYSPTFREPGETDTEVGPLFVDRTAVTNREFRDFLLGNGAFVRSKRKPLLADDAYLKHWTGDLEYPKGTDDLPVVHVSWFVARRYCEWKGMRLPTIAEWEYASDARTPTNEKRILAWYSKAGTALRPVGRGRPNRFGLHDMIDNSWEWVDDFSQTIMAADSRGGGATESLFCGGAALKGKDPSLYASYMRFAFRSSLKANYTSKNLGFRCVRSAKGT